MKIAGIDGCKGGWIGVCFETNQPPAIEVFASFADAWVRYASAAVVLVDMPIGLQDMPRACDVAAQQYLGKKRASIFPAPCRAVLSAAGYAEANALSRQQTGKGLSKQTWNIVPKIREVDTLLRETPAARGRIREAHPEVCFAALNGHLPLFSSKKTPEGQQQRAQLLRQHSPLPLALPAARAFAADDLLDAWCLALTAQCGIAHGFRTFPETPATDSFSFPMELVYASYEL